MIDAVLCGWRVASELPLPDLAPWRGDGRPPDLVIRLGEVPAPPDDAVYRGTLLQIGPAGDCRYEIPGVAAYYIDSTGRTVTVRPTAGSGAPAVRAFLFGTVFAVLCQRRGLLPLHACCVRLESPAGPRAVAFAGPSGAGKSTLAAAFHRLGHVILADDVAVLRLEPAGGASVLPGLPRLKLWRNTLDQLAFPVDGLERIRTETEKYLLPLDDGFPDEPLPLAAVYHLGRVNDPRHGELRRLRGMEAALRLSTNIYRDRMLARLGGGKAGLLAQATRAAAAISRHWSLVHPHDFAALEPLAAELAGSALREAG